MTIHQPTRPKKLKRWELYKKEFHIPELRTEEPIGLYPRQSSKRQMKKNRQSFEKQTVDAVDDIITRGWSKELIKVYDQDMGHSARRALEDKEALSQMFADIRDKVIRTVRAEDVFLEKFTQRLQETQRFDGYEQKVVNDEENKKVEGRRKNLQELIHALTERIDGLFMTLQSPKLDPQERDEFIAERHKLIKRREAARAELNIQSPTQVYLKYKDLIDKMGKYWKRYPFADRQGLVALLVRRVYLEPLSHHFIQMNIVWKEFQVMWASSGGGMQIR